MVKLRKRERDILKPLRGNDATVFTVKDRETARRVGEVAKRLDLRKGIFIGKDLQKNTTIIVDAQGNLRKIVNNLKS